MEQDLDLVILLAKKGAYHSPILLTTSELAQLAQFSQQTASRKLLDLAEAGLIEHSSTINGVSLALTKKGRDLLAERFATLSSLFSKSVTLQATVTKGLGEGRFYMSQNQYKQQFKSLLNFIPFEGTLNLEVDPVAKKRFLSILDQMKIEGFQTSERTFGGLHCYKVSINHIADCALILPIRTNHPDSVIEVIAPINLRDELKLLDGAMIEVKAR